MMSLAIRRHVERDVITAAIRGCLAAGYDLTVNNGEENVLLNSRDEAAILGALWTTDEDHLFLNLDPTTWARAGWIRLIYGNDGWDVINDYTTNLEHALEQATARADFWAGETP